MEQIDDNSIDGMYALESTCHAMDILKVYKEVYRVLKPGALFVESAWALTEKFQPGNPEHEQIKHEIIVSVRYCQTFLISLWHIFVYSWVMDCLTFAANVSSLTN